MDDENGFNPKENSIIRILTYPFRVVREFIALIIEQLGLQDLDYDLGFFSRDDTRKAVYKIIYWITGVIVTIILISFILQLLGILDHNFIFKFIGIVASIFIAPFNGVITVEDLLAQRLNMNAIIAAAVWTAIGILLAGVITSFIHDTLREVVQSAIDSIFKIIEFLIIVRIVFDFLERDVNSFFVSFVDFWTNWTTNVFDVNILGDQFNFSAIMVLAVVAVLDVGTDIVINFLFDRFGEKKDE